MRSRCALFAALCLVFGLSVGPAAAYNSQVWQGSCGYYIQAEESLQSGALVASAYTDWFSGHPNPCYNVRAKVNGNLFGTPWSLNSGWQSGGYATSGAWYGQCDSGQHWAAWLSLSGGGSC